MRFTESVSAQVNREINNSAFGREECKCVCLFAEKSLKEILPFYVDWSLANKFCLLCGTAPPPFVGN